MIELGEQFEKVEQIEIIKQNIDNLKIDQQKQLQ